MNKKQVIITRQLNKGHKIHENQAIKRISALEKNDILTNFSHYTYKFRNPYFMLTNGKIIVMNESRNTIEYCVLMFQNFKRFFFVVNKKKKKK